MTDSVAYLTSYSWLGSRLGLGRMRELLNRMGDPQKQLRFIHLAGTNGKGSAACFLAEMLQAAGYKTGLHTSPYIHKFHERLQINRVPISDEALDRTVAEMRPHAEAMAEHPTVFELVSAAAFAWFYAEKCDIVVLETGMGGRLDATNIIDSPEVSVITPIGLDHMEYLGNTVGEIARSKAGIIKDRTTVVTARQEPAAMAVLEEEAARCQGELIQVDYSRLAPGEYGLSGQHFTFGGLENLSICMLGEYQLENAALALTVAEALAGRGWNIPEEAKRKGLERAKWPGRFELAGERPYVIVDGGHNPPGAKALAQSLVRYFPEKKIVFIMGILIDKDLGAMVEEIVPLAEQVFTITPENPRAMPGEELARYFAELDVPAQAVADTVEAVNLAQAAAGPDGVVCYFGSLYSVGEVKAALGLYE